LLKTYHLKIHKSDFFLYQEELILKRLTVDGDFYCFYTDKKTFLYLKNNNCEIEILKDYISETKKLIFIKKGFIAGLTLFFISFFVSFFYVSNIVFNGNFLINDQIKAEISANYTTFLGLNFITGQRINALNLDVRQRHIAYEWISIEKRGFIIHVNISKDELSKDRPINEERIGDIVATKTGSIHMIQTFHGTPLVAYNDIVRPGDVLISGSFETEDEETEHLLMARGLVLARVFEYVEIRVDKNIVKNELTGKTSFYRSFRLFGLNFAFRNNQHFDNYTLVENEVFRIFNIFSWKNVEKYEKSDIILTYTEEEAREFAESLIEAKFISRKTHALEKLLEILFMTVVEDDEGFTFNFLVSTIENIGEFKGRD